MVWIRHKDQLPLVKSGNFLTAKALKHVQAGSLLQIMVAGRDIIQDK